MGLGENIDNRIKQLGISKKDLAEQSGVPARTIQSIIAGVTTKPSVQSIYSIAEVLKCPVEYLINGEPAETDAENYVKPAAASNATPNAEGQAKPDFDILDGMIVYEKAADPDRMSARLSAYYMAICEQLNVSNQAKLIDFAEMLLKSQQQEAQIAQMKHDMDLMVKEM